MATSKGDQKSPLHTCHEELGGKLISFSGWLMPVQYSGILPEHQAVREHVGLFDISHMGPVFVRGTKAESWLNTLLTNDIRSTAVGEGQYTLMLNEKGGVIDDLLVYRTAEQEFLLILNAAKTREDLNWMQEHLAKGVEIDDAGSRMAALAIQGPKATELIEKLFPQQTILPRRNKVFFWEETSPPLYISRTGYTGEDGFELFFPIEAAEELWKQSLKRMEALDGLPCGLGARDTLRLEACLPLNGNDLGPDISPLEAGLRSFVSFDKPEKFIGSGALREQAESGPSRKSMAFTMDRKSPPPRSGYTVYCAGQEAGHVTSGGQSPTLKNGIGMALIDAASASPGTKIEIEIRGKRYPATLTKKPLYRRNK